MFLMNICLWLMEIFVAIPIRLIVEDNKYKFAKKLIEKNDKNKT